MTLEDAKKVAGVVARADGGCRPCVSDLCRYLDEAFPEFDWSVPEDWHDDLVVTVTHRAATLADV